MDIVVEEILPFVIMVSPIFLVGWYFINYLIINTGSSSDIARIFLSPSNTINILVSLCLIIFIWLIVLYIFVLFIKKFITKNKFIIFIISTIVIISMWYFLYWIYLNDVSYLKVLIKEVSKEAYTGSIIYKNDSWFLIKSNSWYFYYPQERIEYFEFLNRKW